MPWLKRNLLLVLGGAVAVGLLAFAGYFLYSKIRLEQEATAKLQEQTAELERLTKLDPHPGNEKVNNIKAAEDQEKELQQFLAEARRTFVMPDYPKGLDSGQFKLLLDNTVDELQRAADRAKVKLPAQYLFTFANQKPLMSFDADTIEPLAMALIDIRTVCRIIFDAKVLTLDGIRRVALATQDTPPVTGGPGDYWYRKPTTNDWAITMPYEFTFHAFTPELAAVLEGIYRSPYCLLVKNVVVDPSPSPLMEKQPEQPVMPVMPGPGGGMDLWRMLMMSRGRYPYSRYFPPPPPVEQPTTPTPAPGPGGMRTILDEKPFRVIMWVDVVRFREPGAATTPKAPRRRPAPAEPASPEAAPPAAENPAN